MLPLDPVTIRVEGSVSEAPEVREKDAGDRDVDENESRLEEVGIVDRMVFSSRCFVFSQSWPSWSFTLNLMGCSDLVKSVEWGCAVSQKEFESTELGGTLVDAVKAKERSRSVKRPLVLFKVQRALWARLSVMWPLTFCGFICTTIPKNPGMVKKMQSFGGLSWRELSCKQVCGATTGTR